MSTNADNPPMTTINNNEVARLRGLLNRAIEAAEEAIRLADIDYENDSFGKVTWLKKEVAEIEKEAALAPAPEEPVSKKPCSVSVPEDQCWECAPSVYEEPTIPKSATVEPAPEWRLLGPDEVICEGDQVQLKHHNRKGVWIKVWNHEIGATPEDQEAMRYRTRRPLPTTNHKCFSSKLVDETKKEEMPLEDEIEKSLKWIEGDGKYPLDHDEMFGEVCNCLRYLRDEIQKLKES